MSKRIPSVTHLIRYNLENSSRVQAQVAIDSGRVIENVKPFDFTLLEKLGDSAEFGEVFVFHQQSMVVNAYFFYKKFARKHKIIYDIHDLHRFVPIKKIFFKQVVSYIVYSFFEKLLADEKVKFLTVSKGFSDVLTRSYEKPVGVCYSCGITEFDAPQKSHIKKFPSRLIYFGTMSDGRTDIEGLEQICQSGTPVDFYGRVGGSKDFKKRIQRLEAQNLLRFLGPYKGNSIVKIAANYGASLILFKTISANWRYAMPNKLFQSFLAGVPCVISAGMREVEKEFAGLGVVKSISDFLETGTFKFPNQNPQDVYLNWCERNRYAYLSFLEQGL